MNGMYEYKMQADTDVWRVIQFSWDEEFHAWDVGVCVSPSLRKARAFLRYSCKEEEWEGMLSQTFTDGLSHLVWFARQLRKFEKKLNAYYEEGSYGRFIRAEGADERRISAYRYLARLGYRSEGSAWVKYVHYAPSGEE